MFSLYKKELSVFFNSIIGYIVILVFIVVNSLFLWVFPGEMNILDMGYSNIDPLFFIAPWIFLFLVPAVTMRLFADEKKTGTIELLMTRPISDFKIVFSKYLAGLSLVIFSIIPCLIYFVSVYILGSPVGNIDTGGTWGSFIGLLFLAGIYVAIGVFASALTQNQIVAFIVAMLLSFVFYIGFDSISSFFFALENFVQNIGISSHYHSMSRGVIDIRDLVYFISVIGVFLLSTKIVIESRKW